MRKDEDAAEALLDGGDDPNEVEEGGYNALHKAAKGCRLPLFHRILGMIHNVNAVTNGGWTALMVAACFHHLDMVVSLMNYPGIEMNVRGAHSNWTVLHFTVFYNCPITLAQLLSDDRVDTSLKAQYNGTPLKMAINCEHDECVKILREHGAPEE